MLLLVLKSSACLACFMIFYKLLLEKESFHNFKRFYLLAVSIISIVIPFITFTEYIEVPLMTEYTEFIDPEIAEDIPLIETTSWLDYLPTILWTLYLIGVAIFSIRFILNLKNLFHKIRTNPKLKQQTFTNVLLRDLINPHTFFNYIFLNRAKFEHNLIPQEVILHEQTHAKQKHALDILFIELLQIIFWFNPLILLIKKDIKLNHEFLADQAVINQGVEAKKYKETLLAFSSSAKDQHLVNAINYSSIKKRFTVMKTKTSKTVLWLRSLIILPLLAILIYGFSEKRIIEQETTNSIENSISKNKITIHINKDNKIFIKNEVVELSALSQKLLQLTKESATQLLGKPTVLIDMEGHLSNQFLKKLKKAVKKSKLQISIIQAKSMSLDETKFSKGKDKYLKGTQFTADYIEFKLKDGHIVKGISKPKEEIENHPANMPESSNDYNSKTNSSNISPILILINREGKLLVNDELCKIEQLESMMKKLFDKNGKAPAVEIRTDILTPKETIIKVQDILRESGILKVNLRSNTPAEQKNKYNTLVTPAGQKFNIDLSDGTRVSLGPNSKLEYSVLFATSKKASP